MTTSPEHPYSPALVAGDSAYVSGALSVDASGQRVEGAAAALDAALEQVRHRLGTVGLGLEHVAKLTYFVTDVDTRDVANRAFAAAFTEPRPARSFVEVAALPYGCTVEIEATASLTPLRPSPTAAGRSTPS